MRAFKHLRDLLPGRGLVLALATTLAATTMATMMTGCGGPSPDVGRGVLALRGSDDPGALPACDPSVLAARVGDVTVEDLDETHTLVRVGGVAVCVGAVDDPLGATTPVRFAPEIGGAPASSDPMPADPVDDGHPAATPHPADSDPMPADGTRPVGIGTSGVAPGASDPMPADGEHPAASDPMPALPTAGSQTQLVRR